MQVAKQNAKAEQQHLQHAGFEAPATKNITKRREVPQYLLGQKKIITNATPSQINANYNPPQQFVKNLSKTPDRHSSSPKPAEITNLMKRAKAVKQQKTHKVDKSPSQHIEVANDLQNLITRPETPVSKVQSLQKSKNQDLEATIS